MADELGEVIRHGLCRALSGVLLERRRQWGRMTRFPF